MKKLAVPILLLLLLTGCSQTAWETVEDTHSIPTASWLDEIYDIEISVSQDMQLLEACEGWKIYATDDGTFEVETRVFPASDLSTAVEILSGYPAERLNILQTERFDLPEYQFAWVTHTETGERLCRADLVIDGTDCYAVVCSTSEHVGNSFSEEVRQVISSFGLYVDEEV